MTFKEALVVRALIAAQRWDAALAEIDRQLATTPDDGQLLADRSLALLALGRYVEALDAADRAIAVRPTAVPTLRLRAEALRCLGRRRDALDAAERVAALAPTDEGVRITLARCQLLARRRREAEQTANSVVADNPVSVDGWTALGETRLGRDNPGAIDAFRRALAIDPMCIAATNGLGVAYQRMGKRRDAAAMYTQAARLDPHEETPRHNLERLATGLVGLLGIAALVASQALRDEPRLTALAVLGILAVLALPVVVLVRRKRLADLPPEAQAYVESRRRARWRTRRDPRNWPGLVRANPRVTLGAVGLVGVFAAVVAFGPRTERPDRRPDIDLDFEDFQIPTMVPATSAPSVILQCADGSTVPLRPGADIWQCDDFTVVGPQGSSG